MFMIFIMLHITLSYFILVLLILFAMPAVSLHLTVRTLLNPARQGVS